MSQPRIPAALRTAVYERASGRCEYCRIPELATFFPHEPDHVIATQHRGRTEHENLALAWVQCNRLKGPNISSVDPESNQIVPLFNPRRDQWSQHFRAEQGRITPLTPTGWATAAALLNFADPAREETRHRLWSVGQYR